MTRVEVSFIYTPYQYFFNQNYIFPTNLIGRISGYAYTYVINISRELYSIKYHINQGVQKVITHDQLNLCMWYILTFIFFNLALLIYLFFFLMFYRMFLPPNLAYFNISSKKEKIKKREITKALRCVAIYRLFLFIFVKQVSPKIISMTKLYFLPSIFLKFFSNIVSGIL